MAKAQVPADKLPAAVEMLRLRLEGIKALRLPKHDGEVEWMAEDICHRANMNGQSDHRTLDRKLR
jgi:hypothetical protein